MLVKLLVLGSTSVDELGFHEHLNCLENSLDVSKIIDHSVKSDFKGSECLLCESC